MKKVTSPDGDKPNENQDANITQANVGGEAVSKDNEGNVVYDPNKEVTKSSNALSNDTSGATQFVNADTHGITKEDHIVPDSTNTEDESLEDAQKKIEEDTNGDYQAGEDKSQKPGFEKPL